MSLRCLVALISATLCCMKRNANYSVRPPDSEGAMSLGKKITIGVRAASIFRSRSARYQFLYLRFIQHDIATGSANQ
jgi:hypothetical protein